MTTTVRLLDQHQHPLVNVTAEQLKAEIGGAPAKVVAVSPGKKPVVVLLIDISSSMQDEWAESVAASKQLAGSAGEGVGAIVFRDEIVAHASGPSDTGNLLDNLAKAKTSRGGTALYDALIYIAERVKDRDTALVVIGDGEDNASRHSSTETVELFLRSSWPPVFGVVLDYFHQRPRREGFRNIVSSTGGFMVLPSSGSRVKEAVDELATAVQSPSVITLQPSQPISKPAKLKLEVVGSDTKPRHEVQIAHVAKVAACDSTASSSENSATSPKSP